MAKSSLDKFVDDIKKVFGPLTSETVQNSHRLLDALIQAPVSEPWLAELLRDLPNDRELYRDVQHGFVLLAYSEKKGLYRVPHDHGSGWVIYAVHSGEMEMGTYGRVVGQDGKLQLIQRETYRLRAGDSRVYLPGDIHDTRCLSDSVLVFRFTSCDLKKEQIEGRMIRYPTSASSTSKNEREY